ncbi:Glycosyltransferase RgtA/B/C/D-like domain-containing protein [Cupriavidus sp. H19C3]
MTTHKNGNRCVRLDLFLTMVVLAGLIGMLAARHYGFAAMVAAIDPLPERLRDGTFPIWHTHALREHGFLVFYSLESFDTKTAYANHATLYLWFMDLLNHVAQHVPALSMRLTAGWLAMTAMVLTVGFVAHRRLENWHRGKMLLLLLGFVYLATLPTYWIALGKFNVDNGFIFVMPALVMLSHFASERDWGGRAFWFWAIVTALIMPMAGALFAVGLCMQMAGRRRMPRFRTLLVPPLLAALSVAIYMQPVLVLKWLGFASENSSWAFRAGLDGDTRFFSNAVNSVLFPQFRRPFYLILIPLGIVVMQWLSVRQYRIAQPVPEETTQWPFVVNLFTFYALTLLFWPQAVSIHPYLYDAVLIGPLVAWSIVNIASNPVSERAFTVWCFALSLLIMFNLTTIAQASHAPFYPRWDMTNERAG